MGCHGRRRARGVPCRRTCRRAGRGDRHRGPDAGVPVWYSYQPGGLGRCRLAAGRARPRRSALLAVSACACKTTARPAAIASAEGPVLGEDELDPAERLAMACRYLGAVGGNRYLADNPDPGRENVAFRMRRSAGSGWGYRVSATRRCLRSGPRWKRAIARPSTGRPRGQRHRSCAPAAHRRLGL